MTKSLYEQFSSSPQGSRAIASARLRYNVQKILYQALAQSGLTQTDLAKKLGFRKSAINQVFKGDGNLKINTLADYLHAMGCELDIEVLPLGTLRMRAISSEDLTADLLHESEEDIDSGAIVFRASASVRDLRSEDHDMQDMEWTTLRPELVNE